jgi:hypothetical protein
MSKIRFSIVALSLLTIFFIGCAKKCDMPTAVKVDAGPDQSISLPITSVTLTGSVTSGSTSNTNYLWSILSGPSNPTITTNSSTTTTATDLIAGNYLFQFQATNDAGNVGLDTVSVTVNNAGYKTLIIQPGIATGQDAEVDYVPGVYDGNGNDGTFPVLRAIDWTYYGQGGYEGWYRTYIKFTALDTLPTGTQIESAKLTLYGVDSFAGYAGNSTFAGSPYTSSGDNTCILDKVTGNWNQSTITWNTMPGVTTTDEVIVPPSTSKWNYTTSNLDVTQLVQDLIATPGSNFGFCMRLQTETYYREIVYASSEASADSSNGPKLVIIYK